MNSWQFVDTEGDLHPRHEAGLAAINTYLYLVGGRRIKPVDELNTTSSTWKALSHPPIEMHHFQPVVYDGKIYVLGAMTGKYPHETPLSHIWIFDPSNNQWQKGDEIPAERRRGGSGVSLYKNKFYISGGITQGHWDGTKAWFDEYDPLTGTWRKLSDMPHKRDHFQSAIIGDKYYAAGGRITSKKTENVFNQVVMKVDFYDFNIGAWSTTEQDLPTGRAGNSSFAFDGKLWVFGGESASISDAHNDVEILDPISGKWSIGPSLLRGRHGTGVAIIDGHLWTATGSGRRGGRPELLSVEKLRVQ